MAVRVIGRVIGHEEPEALLRVNTVGDQMIARRSLIDEASTKLMVPLTVAYDKVTIFFENGDVVNISSLKKNDEMWVVVGCTARWRSPSWTLPARETAVM
jgi:hypothetical protein